ncbi:hypothetical protein D3C86_1316810 [compost metagenome]
MTSRVEHRIVICRSDAAQQGRRRQGGPGGGVLAKTLGGRGLRIRLIAFRVQGGLAALGRGQRQLSAGILEHVIRCGELFQPEAGFLAGVTQLIV